MSDVSALLAAVQTMVTEASHMNRGALVDRYMTLPVGDHDGMLVSGEVVVDGRRGRRGRGDAARPVPPLCVASTLTALIPQSEQTRQ